MKKFAFLPLFIFAQIILNAQPVITSSIFAPPGQFLVYQSVDTTNLSEGPSGINQTWDYSNVILDGNTDTNFFYLPSNTAYYSFFPSSNLASLETYDPSTVVYFTDNSSFTEFNGGALEDTGDTIVTTYINPQRFIEYPATYNSTMSDPYEIVTSFQLAGNTLYDHTVGTESYLADGYGTFITPAGTCAAGLRFKRRTVEVDTTFINGAIADIIEGYNTHYSWLCQGSTMTFDIVYDTTISIIDGTTYDKQASYTLGISTSIQNINNVIAFNLFPTLSADLINIEISDAKFYNSICIITNSLGEEVFRKELINEKNFQVDINEFRKGNYFVSIKNDLGKSVETFIKL